MLWTQADQDVLRAAMRRGVNTVRYSNGDVVTYQSLQEMMALDKVMSADIAAAAASSSESYSRAAYSRE